MLLRSLTTHVKDQNWFAVALDFFIVVVGILIAFQITNWNERQAEKRRGHDYVERLISDIRSNLAEREGLHKYFEAVNTSAERVVVLLSSPSSDPKEFVVNVYRATEQATHWPTAATWNEVVSSGDIGLLPAAFVDGGLGELIFTTDDAERHSENMLSSPYRKRVRRTIPHEIQLSIRNGCGDVRDKLGTVVGFKADCVLNVSDEDISKAAEALRADPDLLPDLWLHFSVLSMGRGDSQGTINALEDAVRILEETK